MNYRLINYQTQKILDNRQRIAISKADKAMNTACSIKGFPSLYNEYNALVPEIALLKFQKKNADFLIEKRNQMGFEISTLLKEKHLTISDLTPTYYCKICSDTGLIEGRKCKCYQKIVSQLEKKILSATNADSNNLDTINSNIISTNKDSYDRLLKNLKGLVESFPVTSKRFLVFTGATGTGKTFLSNALANSLEKNGFECLNMTAFALNNAFLKFHTTFDDSSSNILDPIINASVLVIDDLGAEPHFNNVTNEYLMNIINERTQYGKLTIITTNLSPDLVAKKYSLRIHSRLYDKNNAMNIEFNYEDLRLQK